jgi:cystathionine beta-synthase
MQVLLVVGTNPDDAVPERFLVRADRVLHAPGGDLGPSVLADVRGHIPEDVAVIGPPAAAVNAAVQLREHGFPVTLYLEDGVTPPGLPAGVRVAPVQDPGRPMDVADSLLDLIGETPIVRLDRVGRRLQCHLLAKLEHLNPGGSAKDRPALAMIEAGEKAGLLKPGGTIIEPTSGNTGVGLAIVAARRRYRCVFVMPDKMAPEKIKLLRAYGAEVIVCPSAVAPDHPDSYYSVANRLADEIPGGFQPNQYHNAANPEAHLASTGPEIWRQTSGRITHFVSGVGTGGTISGVGQYLKSQNPAIQIIGADPEGSVYSGGTGRPYLVEGIGEDFWPTTYDASVVDRVVAVSDGDSFMTARRVTREEGLLIGGSGGTAVWAALEVGRELGPDDVMVVVIPDSGRGYLSKVYDDEWMSDYGFLHAGGQTVGDVLDRKTNDLPALVHVHPDETVREAIAIMREYEVSQMLVVRAEPPLAAAEIAGSVGEKELLGQAFSNPGILDRPVAEVMSKPLPTVGRGEPVDDMVAALELASAVVVLDGGSPVGILTRTDLLHFLTGGHDERRRIG